MKNMKSCPKHKWYPARFDKCPSCHSDAKSAPLILSKEDIAKATEVSLARGDLDTSQVKE